MAGPRAAIYAGDSFTALRAAFEGREPSRPDALSTAYFRRSEPEELLIDEVEALWAAIAEARRLERR